MRKSRSRLEVQKAFPDEAACAAFLFKTRWPSGICPKCGNVRFVLLKSRAWTYQYAGAPDRYRSVY